MIFFTTCRRKIRALRIRFVCVCMCVGEMCKGRGIHLALKCISGQRFSQFFAVIYLVVSYSFDNVCLLVGSSLSGQLWRTLWEETLEPCDRLCLSFIHDGVATDRVVQSGNSRTQISHSTFNSMCLGFLSISKLRIENESFLN